MEDAYTVLNLAIFRTHMRKGAEASEGLFWATTDHGGAAAQRRERNARGAAGQRRGRGGQRRRPKQRPSGRQAARKGHNENQASSDRDPF